MDGGRYITIYVGDYSVMIWKRADETERDAIKREFNYTLHPYRLRVKEA